MGDAIGGYMGLEYPIEKKTYHPYALKLNSARSCIEIILKATRCKKIYIPYFTCDVVLDIILKLGVNYSFYRINRYFEPVIDFDLKDNELLLCTNYWGLKNKTIERLVGEYSSNIVVDSAQSFFDQPINGNYFLFNSCRKFFGVLDGAYLYYHNNYENIIVNYVDKLHYPKYVYRDFLLDRIELGAEKGYNSFLKHEQEIGDVGVCRMSKLSENILSLIDYEKVKTLRHKNFMHLHKHLCKYNLIDIESIAGDSLDFIPMVYPLLIEDKEIRAKLIKDRIYVAKYWPNVKYWIDEKSLECYYSENIIPLPIDQRLYTNIEFYIHRLLNIIGK